ncbi:MAG: hypothetical protein GC203_17045 [Phenylobacterium sp.]|uniref:hypothetical protein n=1 Tax=Phenylobacterium sp. TaxID=1871053 RepID=UPI0025EE4A75|nr:hypothetical protein [Phenylobacterium sp.]MBI1199570.1 hypothetical protein [Phenylobacterium sp.]
MFGSRSIPDVARPLAAAAALCLLAAPASAQEMTQARFAQIMDAAFGQGVWRMTGGYRTPQREDQLRAQGAMTVRPGGTSRHSLGSADAPGAFDLVVDGMSPYDAADRLRRAGAPFARYQPKGAHGTQGPHLHLEPYGFGSAGVQVAAFARPAPEVSRMRPLTLSMPAVSARGAADIREKLARLRADASRRQPGAQLELGRAYAAGYIVPRDFETAQEWLQAAADNPDADPQTRGEAAQALAEVSDLLAAQRAQAPARLAQLGTRALGR